MKFLVYHDKLPSFGFDLGQRTAVFPESFQKVAEVKTNSIEEAFALTNHIHDDWTKNPEVVPIGKQHRSTSPGDIVVDENGDVHLCKMMGWEKIGSVSDGNITIKPEMRLV